MDYERPWDLALAQDKEVPEWVILEGRKLVVVRVCGSDFHPQHIVSERAKFFTGAPAMAQALLKARRLHDVYCHCHTCMALEEGLRAAGVPLESQ